MEKRTIRRGEIQRTDWVGISDWDSDSIGDAHQRIADLERIVQTQGRLIEALIVANARGERIHWPDCTHNEVTFNRRNCDDGGPIMSVQCDKCHQDIVIFRSSIDNVNPDESG